MPPPVYAGLKHNVFPPGRLSVHSFVRYRTKLVKHEILKRMNRFCCKLVKLSTGQGDETINFGVRRSKVKLHTTPKLDLEACMAPAEASFSTGLIE